MTVMFNNALKLVLRQLLDITQHTPMHTFAAVRWLPSNTYVRNVKSDMRTGVAAQKNTHRASRYLRAARLRTSALRSSEIRCENRDSQALSFIARIPHSASLITCKA